MSEPKAQLVDPQGNMNLPGMNATGVITASSFSGSGGVVTGLTGGGNLNVGVVTATSFVGDGTGHAANLTGTPNLNLGLTTATSFVGDAVGKAAGLTGTPNLNVGLVTATSFAGNVTGDVTGNITGLAGSITPGVNLNVGVATAISWYGDGSGLTGAGSSASIAQEITAINAETIIDLSDGNLIYYKGNANTTVGFASTSPAEQITFIRDTDSNYSISISTGGVTFDGTDDYLTMAAANSNLNWAAGDSLTIESFVNLDTQPPDSDGYTIINRWENVGGSGYCFGFNIKDSGNVFFYEGDGNTTLGTAESSGVTISAGSWYHIAIVKDGTTGRFFINGQAAGTFSWNRACTNSSQAVLIGALKDGSVSRETDGTISNVRFTNGQALYTTDFVPPSGELTTTSQGAVAANVEILCCQSTSSTTTGAVTTGTITANSSPTAGAQTISLAGSLNATITWPDRVNWSGGVAPTLFTNIRSSAFQIFHFTTGDTGLTYTAWEEMKTDSSKNQLWGWGQGGFGNLATDPVQDMSSPVQIGTESTWSYIAAMDYPGRQAMIKTDGTLWTWGNNDHGELGLNYQTERSSPCQVGADTDWATVKINGTSGGSMLATRTDGTAWAWGSNQGSDLALNQPVDYRRSSPTQLPGTAWSAFFYNGAIKTDGTLWTWGNNNYGQGGHNNRTTYSSPRQVGTNTTWAVATAGGNCLFAVKTNGTLWSWGYNGYGQLGLNSESRYSSPVQVGTNTTWSQTYKKIDGGGRGCQAIKTDGTLWVWGYNTKGQLGLNQPSTTELSSPTQVGTDSTWNSISLSYWGSMASKTDGSLWVWGSNVSGRLGLNQAPAGLGNVSSPTQITGTWIDPDKANALDSTGANSWALKAS